MADSERITEIRSRRERGTTPRAEDVKYLLAVLDEIEQIARNPGFATRSGEPRDALDAIAEIFDRG